MKRLVGLTILLWFFTLSSVAYCQCRGGAGSSGSGSFSGLNPAALSGYGLGGTIPGASYQNYAGQLAAAQMMQQAYQQAYMNQMQQLQNADTPKATSKTANDKSTSDEPLDPKAAKKQRQLETRRAMAEKMYGKKTASKDTTKE
jgi:hypothetical protein